RQTLVLHRKRLDALDRRSDDPISVTAEHPQRIETVRPIVEQRPLFLHPPAGIGFVPEAMSHQTHQVADRVRIYHLLGLPPLAVPAPSVVDRQGGTRTITRADHCVGIFQAQGDRLLAEDRARTMLGGGDYWIAVQLRMCRDAHDVEVLSLEHLRVVLIERCNTPFSTEGFQPLMPSIRSGDQAGAGMTGERASVRYRHGWHRIQFAADSTAANETDTQNGARPPPTPTAASQVPSSCFGAYLQAGARVNRLSLGVEKG